MVAAMKEKIKVGILMLLDEFFYLYCFLYSKWMSKLEIFFFHFLSLTILIRMLIK